MKLLIVKPIMTEPRFNFDRTIELSKYMDVMWICGWMTNPMYEFKYYEKPKHKIIVYGQSKLKRRFQALFQELQFVVRVIALLNSEKPDLILVHSHRLAFLYPVLCPKQKYVLQMFTTAVCPSIIKRKFWDVWEWFVSRPYKTVFVGTAKMIDLFKLSHKHCYITRWGMHPISKRNKGFEELNLLYIGVLTGRNIHDTVTGLKLFLDRYPHVVVKYSIIGAGKDEYVDMIRREIDKYSLGAIVTLHGYLSDEDIRPFFDSCNVGVSYVPITPYYTDVIVTKSVEYLISGLAVLATNTNENRKMISGSNGVLIDDTPAGFAQGLSDIYERLNTFDSSIIVQGSKEWLLDLNVREVIVPMLQEIIAK